MACAAISTFANVNVSLMMPRQPDVPNLITDMPRIIAATSVAVDRNAPQFVIESQNPGVIDSSLTFGRTRYAHHDSRIRKLIA